MSRDTSRLVTLMAEAVDFSVRHVEAGGLPFVGLLVADDGSVSDPGVNLVRETGDPSAHAEIVAMRHVLQERGLTSLKGMTLLATGEPCALCYRFAAEHGVDAVHFAVDRTTVARWGFDYRSSYDALGTDRLLIAQGAQLVTVDRGLEPFARFLELHGTALAPQH
ncbi:nucleoside deaminase [Rhodococcus tibetensis]|uniref:Nucleoside deaminase n=1 Tax=Rhodococcus tibetensis TaxID=2965064 RepID=A0ABT1QBP6_9NOCA|nr:nucleoside deaminase [Rhodococcus sp. FXJ9.536]MCQ4119709.1 nucleoside deaminase [Rhodococcus sp. FXJ9.536]